MLHIVYATAGYAGAVMRCLYDQFIFVSIGLFINRKTMNTNGMMQKGLGYLAQKPYDFNNDIE
jgi:hypothetical protein